MRRYRIMLVVLAVTGLVFVFLFQRLDLAVGLGIDNRSTAFLVNRSVRFLINDGLTILLIYALFNNRKYVLFAVLIQLAGIIFVLLPYFMIKLNYPAYNGPLISFLHRLVVNPMLLLMLIPAFYYQARTR